MTRVTADSNIYVSALVFSGKPFRLLEMALDRAIHLAISPAIREETLGVLKDKFAFSAERLSESQDYLKKCAEVVVPTQTLNVIVSDPDDDRVLECAVEARSEIIVSGDSDLLTLKSYAGIRIMKVADFLAEYDR